MSEYKDKTPEQITDEDYKVAPTSSDKEKKKIANPPKTDRQPAEENRDNSTVKADQAEDRFSEIAREKSALDLASRQATCNECGLTARNKQELQDHFRYAHKRATS